MRISAKDLGWLTTDDFCPRCFWIECHAKGLPYQTGFPGIFFSIDACWSYVYFWHVNLSVKNKNAYSSNKRNKNT